MQLLTQYSEHSVVLVIIITPELNTDFYFKHPKLEIRHKNQQVL